MTNKPAPIREELLRDALTGGAATVTSNNLRTLREPAPRREISRRWLVPAGIGLATVTATATALWPHSSARIPSRAPTRIITLAAYSGLKYYVGGATWGGAPVSSYDSATGRTIAQVPTPRGVKGFWQVAGTGDNKTFFLSAANQKTCKAGYYRLHLNDDGKPASLAALTNATLPGLPTGELAATENGTTLAQVTQSCDMSNPNVPKTRLNIINARSGTQRGFDLPPMTSVLSLAWAPDNRHLGLISGVAMDQLSMSVLDTTTAHSLADARVITRAESLNISDPEFKRTAITPDGTQAVVLMITGAEQSRLLWYSLATGRLTREMTLHNGHQTDRSLLKPSPNGLLVIAGDYFYRVEGTTSHNLPAPSDPHYLDWDAAW